MKALADLSPAQADPSRAEASRWFAEAWEEIRLDAYAGRSRGGVSAHCMQLVNRARGIATRLGDARLRAESDRMTAYVLNALERFEEALPFYERTVSAFETLGLPEVAARARLGLAQALQMTGSHERSLEVCREADSWFVRSGDLPGHARALTILGGIQHRLDSHSDALRSYQEASHILERLGDFAALSTAMLNTANGYVHLDCFDESEAMYARAVQVAAAQGLTPLADQATFNLAYLQFLRGRYADALATFSELAARCAGDDNRRQIARCELVQAEIYVRLDLPEESLALATSAAEQCRALGMRMEQARALALAGASRAQTQQFAEALDFLSEAHALFEVEKNTFWTATLELYRAEVLLSMGRLPEARSLADVARDRFQALDMDSEWGLAVIVSGRVALAMKDIGEARTAAGSLMGLIQTRRLPVLEFPAFAFCASVSEAASEVDKARRYYEAAARSIDDRLGHLLTDDLRIRHREGTRAVYEALVNISLESAVGTEADAFVWCERAQARRPVDLLRQHLPVLPAEADEGLLHQVHRSREVLHSRYMRARPEGGPFVSTVSDDVIDGGEKRLEDGLRQLTTADPRFASMLKAAPASLSPIQGVLPAGTALVEYFVCRGEILVFVATRGAVRAFRGLGSLDRVRALKQRLFYQMKQFDAAAGNVPQLDPHMESTVACLEELFDNLVRPWVDEIAESRLVFVLDAELHGLPFHAFSDGVCYLVDRRRVSYAPSAETLGRVVRMREARGGHGLIVGAPEEPNPAGVEDIRRLLLLEPTSRVLAGASSRRPRFLAEAGVARFIHIRTGSFFSSRNPLCSGFRLADGPITGLDLHAQSWSAGLVTLCGLPAATHPAGDELMSLAQAFINAGARSVLTSIWNMNDDATATLVESFYRDWRRGDDKAEALQGAMLETRLVHPHPFHWAGFALIGAP